MRLLRAVRIGVTTAMALVITTAAFAQGAQAPAKPFEPQVGQAGKDVVWVPTPQALVDKMLDLAKVTPQDFLMDLGSGDGRTVITAAKRGLNAQGIEYNPDMVDLATRNATAAGVSARAVPSRNSKSGVMCSAVAARQARSGTRPLRASGPRSSSVATS